MSAPKLPKKDANPASNWVEQTGGLPDYIDRVARHIYEGQAKKDVGRAIAGAVNTMRRWIADPDTKPDTKAKATAALAEWEAKKKAAKADNAKNLSQEIDEDSFYLALSACRADLDLSAARFTLFDPRKHPRDFRGRFRDLVGELRVGDAVLLPDGTRVEGRPVPGSSSHVAYTINKPGAMRVPTFTSPQKAADEALDRSARNESSGNALGGNLYFEGAADVEAFESFKDDVKGDIEDRLQEVPSTLDEDTFIERLWDLYQEAVDRAAANTELDQRGMLASVVSGPEILFADGSSLTVHGGRVRYNPPQSAFDDLP